LISLILEKLFSRVAALTAIVRKIRNIITIFGTEFPNILLNKLQKFKGAFFLYCDCTSATTYNRGAAITFFLIAQQ